MTTPSRKHWPKKPILDYSYAATIGRSFLTTAHYSKDEFIRINVGTPPNIDTFYVSKIRLAYYSPYFRTSLNFLREDSQVIELPDTCPKIFRHIVQYMNTGTIIISESDEVIVDHKYSKNTPRERHLDLPILARIWFLAHYLLIPHIQNIAIHLMYARVTHSGDHSGDIRASIVDETVAALDIACGNDGTVVEEDNNVIKLLQRWIIQISIKNPWFDDRKRRFSGKALGIMAATWRESDNSQDYDDYIIPLRVEIRHVFQYYVEDKIDGGDVMEGLPDFPPYRDSDEE
ncbi:hypothetical protein BELL_0077g00140 [Botrytis elliptica]|uniref:BTB domain-containing protein n=1 Tax=Botrytis elliptica TaxID=278938 RepID=A0A4Z1JYA5_9HELO|nr:hypothetical protein EAE99_009034 [Botrytis elliptica]TGO78144.1 hypothetical protein BELL_0077g00140 [Botrytis elliptica]